jgi:hypothetical protein
MKRKITLFLLTFALFGCEGEKYYMEGRVNTFDATEIAATSAILNGSLEILYESSETDCKVIATGFRLSENAHFSNPKEISAGSGKGNFKASAGNLKPNTKYYVQAYAQLAYRYGDDSYERYRDDDDKTFYGNTVEFSTIK